MAIIRENKGDAKGSADTQYSISLGDFFRGAFDAILDVDWIRVELDAGKIYDIRLAGTDALQLALLDAEGKLVISGGYVSSVSELIIFSPAVSGTYYIQAIDVGSSTDVDYGISFVENTIATGTYDEVAGFLTDGYQELSGRTRAAFDVEPGGVLTADITALTEAGQQLARWALEAWTNVTGIKFEFVDDENAQVVFDDDNTGSAYSNSEVLDGSIVSSFVNVPAGFLNDFGSEIDSYAFTVYLHETGHALGLGHPGPYNGRAAYGALNAFLIDSYQATLMSYTNQPQNTYINATLAYPVTPMIADIIAVQELYGVPDDINAGDTVYGYQSDAGGYLGRMFELWSGEENHFFNIDVGSDSAPAFADLDNDGDLDLAIGEFGIRGSIDYFENTGGAANPEFTQRTGAANPMDGLKFHTRSSPAFIDLDGDGDPDLVVGNYNGTISYFENTGGAASPRFTQRSGAASPLDGVNVNGTSARPAFTDLDDDGDPDLVIGHSNGALDYFENTGGVANPGFTQRSGAANPFAGVSAGSYSAPEFADLDGDGDPDLILGSNRGGVGYFENTGTAADPDFSPANGVANPLLSVHVGGYGTPKLVDLDGDGDFDLTAGNIEGTIDYYQNTGSASQSDFVAKSTSNDIALTLYDNNGIDTLDLRTDSGDQRVDLRPEGISDVYGAVGNLVIARDTLIENFIAGTGDDRIIGNSAANRLEGGAGADSLDGGAGADWASYRGSNAGVTVNLGTGAAGGGHAAGDVIVNVENLEGSAYADSLTGDAGANRLEGGAGADRLDGGAGADWASYRGSNAGVTVNLGTGAAGGGHAAGDVIVNVENLVGSAYADSLTGDAGANRLEGGAGADRLDGGAGADWASYRGSNAGVTVNLGTGAAGGGHAAGDVIVNVENLVGSAYADSLTGDAGANRLEGGAGADSLDGGAGADWASYRGSNAGVTVNLGTGAAGGGHAAGDVIVNVENLVGSAYADSLTGDAGANRLEGGAGADNLEGGAGADRLDGGAGEDWASYRGSATGVTVKLRDGTGERGHAEGDVIAGVEHLEGSAYSDVLGGDSGANRLVGGDGNDGLWGSSGNDVLEGGAGADRLYGGIGDDWISYHGSDTGVTVNLADGTGKGGHAQGDRITDVENVTGSDHEDVLTGDAGANRLEGGGGADQLDGGAGEDRVSYRGSAAGVTVNLSDGAAEGGHAEGDEIVNFENVTGTDYADILTGDARANRLAGGRGDDELRGSAGNDVLEGGAGADRLNGGAGADRLAGGAGEDWASYRGSDAGVTVKLRTGTGEKGHAEGDVIAGVENLEGSAYNDVLGGDSGANRLAGGDGNDGLWGSSGNDVLEGGAGSDRLNGGDGVDSVSYLESSAGVEVSLEDDKAEGGHAQGDVFVSIENVTGSGYGDVLVGNIGFNRLEGAGGNDVLRGNAGNDTLEGGPGADWLEGGPGADRLDGGAGEDTVSFQGSDTGVRVDLRGIARHGHAEGDIITNVENLMGSAYGDILSGDDNDNYLNGGAGDDILWDHAGDDIIEGGAGSDEIYTLEGNDTFVFEAGHGNDTIYFFDDALHGSGDGEDLIDLTAFNLGGFDALDISTVPDGVLIDLTEHGGGTILLDKTLGGHFDSTTLDATDFLF